MAANKDDPLHSVAGILRSRGFVQLPKLWVKPKDMPKVHKIAGQYRDEVNDVRAMVREQQVTASDPLFDRDAAWEEIERMRRSG